jgi:uncharacterized protein YegP (UPF0339 family)
MEAQVEIYERADGEWSWRLRAANGEHVGGAGEGFRDPHDAQRAFYDFIDTLDAAMVQATVGAGRGNSNPAARMFRFEEIHAT